MAKSKKGLSPKPNPTGRRVRGGTSKQPSTQPTITPQNVDQSLKDTNAHSSPESADAQPAVKPITKDTEPAASVEPSQTSVSTVPAQSPAPSSTVQKEGGLGLLLKSRPTPEPDNSPHLIVEARAGTGKTTTLVEGLKIVKGLPSSLIPSPQQKAVWDCMALSRGKVQSIGFVAFNKSIAEELKRRVPPGCEAMTMHSLGFKAVRNSFNLLPGKDSCSEYRVQNIICEITGKDIWDLRAKKPTLLKATEQLVGLCKMNLVGNGGSQRDDEDEGSWELELSRLASYYDVELNDSQREIFDLAPRVLERCKDVGKDRYIDYDDMIWLPVVLNLPVQKYDMLLVDEAQDLNRCQQALAKKAGKRLILCGDPKQAIYGFAGADAQSMNRMRDELRSMPRGFKDEGLVWPNPGVQVLPLTVTRRCGKTIVREANKYVPDFEAHETCCEGKVSHKPIRGGVSVEYASYVQDGDFILCRVNAPLVSECFKFLKMGRKANIQGRDVGQGLISTVKKMNATSVPQLIAKIEEWKQREYDKEQAKKFPSEQKLTAISDRADCLTCFTEDANSVDDVIRKIESIFTDNKEAPGIRLSSIHKAKGLEAKRVFFLRAEGMCGPPLDKLSSWEREQEINLIYVGITRAQEELVYVT